MNLNIPTTPTSPLSGNIPTPSIKRSVSEDTDDYKNKLIYANSLLNLNFVDNDLEIKDNDDITYLLSPELSTFLCSSNIITKRDLNNIITNNFVYITDTNYNLTSYTTHISTNFFKFLKIPNEYINNNLDSLNVSLYLRPHITHY